MRILILPPKGKDIARKYTTPDGEEHVYPVELTKFTIIC